MTPEPVRHYYSGLDLGQAADYSALVVVERVRTVNEFKDVLPAPPSASREFPRQDTLAVFAEVYDNVGKTPHRVEITAVSKGGAPPADDSPAAQKAAAAGGERVPAKYNTKSDLGCDVPAGGRCYARIDDAGLLADVEEAEWVGSAVDVVSGDEKVNVIKG